MHFKWCHIIAFLTNSRVWIHKEMINSKLVSEVWTSVNCEEASTGQVWKSAINYVKHWKAMKKICEQSWLKKQTFHENVAGKELSNNINKIEEPNCNDFRSLMPTPSPNILQFAAPSDQHQSGNIIDVAQIANHYTSAQK